MARSDVRCDLQLPVEIFFNSHHGDGERATTANIGLGGAFISSDQALPENSVVKFKTQIPNFGILETKGKVLRRQDEGFALKFLNLDTEGITNLWGLIISNLAEQSACPYCGSDVGSDVGSCEACGRNLDFFSDPLLDIRGYKEKPKLLETLNAATEEFNNKLGDIELRCNNSEEYSDRLVGETYDAVRVVCSVCHLVDEAVADPEELNRKRAEFRLKTNDFMSKSHLVNHARTWPKGYQGDYKMIENVYRNMPMSKGLGYFLDKNFLTTDLAIGVRKRLATMKDILKGEIVAKANPRVFNLGCGSCREIFELAPEIESSGAEVTCIDLDSDALNFATNRLYYAGIDSQVKLRKYNVLRMVNHEKNLKEFGPQDIIYSMGLFDYLADDVLTRLLKSLYELLNPEGKLVVVFKDSDFYQPQQYHWLVEWDAFHLRNGSCSRDLIRKAGIPDTAVDVKGEGSIILFYSISKR